MLCTEHAPQVSSAPRLLPRCVYLPPHSERGCSEERERSGGSLLLLHPIIPQSFEACNYLFPRSQPCLTTYHRATTSTSIRVPCSVDGKSVTVSIHHQRFLAFSDESHHPAIFPARPFSWLFTVICYYTCIPDLAPAVMFATQQCLDTVDSGRKRLRDDEDVAGAAATLGVHRDVSVINLSLPVRYLATVDTVSETFPLLYPVSNLTSRSSPVPYYPHHTAECQPSRSGTSAYNRYMDAGSDEQLRSQAKRGTGKDGYGSANASRS